MVNSREIFIHYPLHNVNVDENMVGTFYTLSITQH
jgi:hypothetical protein